MYLRQTECRNQTERNGIGSEWERKNNRILAVRYLVTQWTRKRAIVRILMMTWMTWPFVVSSFNSCLLQIDQSIWSTIAAQFFHVMCTVYTIISWMANKALRAKQEFQWRKLLLCATRSFSTAFSVHTNTWARTTGQHSSTFHDTYSIRFNSNKKFWCTSATHSHTHNTLHTYQCTLMRCTKAIQLTHTARAIHTQAMLTHNRRNTQTFHCLIDYLHAKPMPRAHTGALTQYGVRVSRACT